MQRITKKCYFCALIGEMAERSNAAVLKTVDLHGSGGSNPSLSANNRRGAMHCASTCFKSGHNVRLPCFCAV